MPDDVRWIEPAKVPSPETTVDVVELLKVLNFAARKLRIQNGRDPTSSRPCTRAATHFQ